MSYRVHEDIPSGFYKSIDDINNFRIRVCIQKSVPSCLPHSDSPDHIQSENLELLPIHRQDKKLILEQVFSWQEKVSKLEEREISASSLRTCSKNSGRPDSHIKLFTYVDSELRSLESKNTAVQLRNSEADCKLKRRHLFLCGDRTYQKPFIVDVKDVIQNSVSKKPYEFVGQMMSIAALFDADDNSEDFKEVQLCMMHYDSHGVLRVTPDFSRTPYFIQSCSSERYELMLENASNPMNKAELQKSRNFFKQIGDHHARTVQYAVGGSFDMPPEGTVTCFINGEIGSAIEFESKNVFVRFTFEASKDLLVEGNEFTSEVTHSSRMKWRNNVKVAEFGYPFTLEINLDAKEIQSFDGQVSNIGMLLEVVSVDWWGALRNEGYGFCNIPLQAGRHCLNIQTWKLLPQTLHGKLRNFFIGGMPILDDISYVATPRNLQDPRVNKCGIRSETSGSVTVNIYVIMHYGSKTSPHDLIHKKQVASNH